MNKTKSLLFFLSALTIGQVCWWAYLIIDKQNQLNLLQQGSVQSQNVQFMILFEGAFFLLAWSIGFYLAFRSYQKEINLRKMQSDFLETITHELKTPITNIRLCLDTLERPSLTLEQKNTYLKRAQSSTDQLLNEIESVLQLSNQDLSTVKEKIEVNQFLENLIKKTQQEQPSTKIQFKPLSSPEEILIGKNELELILKNIISNSIKYSKTDDLIQISVDKTKSHIKINIKDNGIGLDTNEIKKVFIPFWRSENSLKKAIPGTGVGLSLAHRLSQKIDADLKLKSGGRNTGVEAEVLLKLGGNL